MTAVSGDLLTTRNATIDDLVVLLRDQQARKVDVVASASSVRAEGGCLVLDGTMPVLGEDGVTMAEGRYRPTDVCDGGIADKLGIPAGYLRRTRDSHSALFDANVNGWLERDERRFFIRALGGADGATGVARAWLSDGYKKIDHLDTLMAVFDGIRKAGHPVQIETCDLTGRRMYGDRVPRPRPRRRAGAGDGTARPAPGDRRAQGDRGDRGPAAVHRGAAAGDPRSLHRREHSMTDALAPAVPDLPLLRSVLSLAGRGWHLFPCVPGAKRPRCAAAGRITPPPNRVASATGGATRRTTSGSHSPFGP